MRPLKLPQVAVGDLLSLHATAAEPATDHLDTPLVADARRLAKLLGVGLRTVRGWDSAGRLPSPVRVGGKVLWRLDEIRNWLDAGCPNRETWAARCAARK